MNRAGCGIAVLAVGIASPAVSEEFWFGWKPGTTCEVRNRLRKQDNDVTLTYVLRASAAPDGNLYINVENPGVEYPGRQSLSAEERLLGERLVAVNMPSFEVDEEGTLVGLKDLDGTQRKLRAMYEKSFGKDPAKLDKVMQQIATKDLLENTIGMMWNPAVYLWASTSLEAGKPVRNTVETALPIGNIAVTMDTTAEYTGEVPCGDGGRARCARLVTAQVPDVASFERAIVELMKKFGGEMNGARFEKLDLRTTTETVTDPETMIPVSVKFERRYSARVIENGKATDAGSLDRREWLFDCRP